MKMGEKVKKSKRQEIEIRESPVGLSIRFDVLIV